MAQRWSLAERVIAVSAMVALSVSCGSAPQAARPAAAPAPPVTPVIPTLGPGETAARSLALAMWSTCVLLVDETVWCWGTEHDGTIGVRDGWPRQLPLAHVVDLAAAGERTYAVTRAGDLYLIGRELTGARSVKDATLPHRMPVSEVRRIAVSRVRACALSGTGQVDCWVDMIERPKRLPVSDVTAVSASVGTACVIVPPGRVRCFADTGGQTTPDVSEAVELVSAEDVTCARTRAGAVRCWSDDGAPRPATAASFPAATTALKAASSSLCAWSVDGAPHCVEVASQDGRYQALMPPEQALSGHGSVSDVRVAQDHACFIDAGSVWCWGSNTFGQLGRPSMDDHASPIRVELGDLASLQASLAVAVAPGHQCILGTDGLVRCWGTNEFGQLGTGDLVSRAFPTRVSTLADVVSIGASRTHTCAVTREGRVLCAGLDFGGGPDRTCSPMADAPAACALAPVEVTAGAVAVAVGDGFACSLDEGGGVRCWGDNDWGQLGAGDLVPSASPRVVVDPGGRPIRGVKKLKAFGLHACAIDDRGGLSCWGANRPLEQGRGYEGAPRLMSATPLATAGPTADVSSQCILAASGELRCWGATFEGQRDTAYEPSRVGTCDAQLVSDGIGFCAVSPGELRCTGTLRLADRWQRGAIAAPITHVTALAGDAESERVCVIDGEHRLSCWSWSSFDHHAVLGLSTPTWLDWPAETEGCARDAPPAKLPSFPPEPFETVTAKSSSGATRKLLAGEIESLIAALNDVTSYAPMSTCSDADLMLSFRDAVDREVGLVTFSLCGTMEANPQIPARARIGGNAVTGKLAPMLQRFGRELAEAAPVAP